MEIQSPLKRPQLEARHQPHLLVRDLKEIESGAHATPERRKFLQLGDRWLEEHSMSRTAEFTVVSVASVSAVASVEDARLTLDTFDVAFVWMKSLK